jgi:hypothetical protein
MRHHEVVNPRFGMSRSWRIQLVALAVAFGVVGIGPAVFAVIDGRAAPVFFWVLWALALAWNAYWFGWRVPLDFEIAAGVLRWRAPLASGQLALDDIDRVRPMRGSPEIEVICGRGGPKIPVVMRREILPLFEALAAIRPDLDVRISERARTARRIPGLPRFRRRDVP